MRDRMIEGWRRSAPDGAVGGLIGGLAMALASAALFPVLGLGDAWRPAALLAAVFVTGMVESEPTAAAIVLASVVHLSASVVLGLAFAGAFARFGSVLGRAVLAALVVWALAVRVVLPAVAPALLEGFPPLPLAVAHAVYGIALGGYLAVRDRLRGVITVTPPRSLLIEDRIEHRATHTAAGR